MNSITETDQTKHRRSIRLKGYDYTQPGCYFVTICVNDHLCLFGEIEDNKMSLNRIGGLVQDVWNSLPVHYPEIELDAFVIMPNHVHGIISLVGAGFKPAPIKHGLPEIVRAFKTFSARRINAVRGTSGATVWQRNYYEHIIRSEKTLDSIREYIYYNPAQWDKDDENSLKIKTGRV